MYPKKQNRKISLTYSEGLDTNSSQNPEKRIAVRFFGIVFLVWCTFGALFF